MRRRKGNEKGEAKCSYFLHLSRRVTFGLCVSEGDKARDSARLPGRKGRGGGKSVLSSAGLREGKALMSSEDKIRGLGTGTAAGVRKFCPSCYLRLGSGAAIAVGSRVLVNWAGLTSKEIRRPSA